MKFAVASDDGVDVALHTGRCRKFVIYEVAGTAVRRAEVRTNGFTAHAMGQCQGHQEHEPGAGPHSHGALIDALGDCSALVTRGLGPRLVAELMARGVEVYLCADQGADEAACLCAAGQLPKARPGGGCCCHHE